MNKKVFFQNTFFLITSGILTVIVIWLAGEIILRLVVPYEMKDIADMYIKSENEILNKELRPAFRGIYYGRQVEINSRGFRDYEYAVSKPPGVYRIILLGDSMCFGQNLKLDDIYPKIMERNLNSRFISKSGDINKIEVLNFAVPGYNTKQEYELLKTRAIVYSPDLVILNYYLNDIEPKEFGAIQYKQGLSSPEVLSARWIDRILSPIKEKSYFAHYLMNHTIFLFRRIGVQGGDVSRYSGIFEDNNELWLKNKKDLLSIKRLAQENNLDLIIVLIPFLTDLGGTHPLRKEHSIVANFCRSNGMKVIDFLPYFHSYKATSLWINPLDGHPNKKAHQLMADAIGQYVFSQIIAPLY